LSAFFFSLVSFYLAAGGHPWGAGVPGKGAIGHGMVELAAVVELVELAAAAAATPGRKGSPIQSRYSALMASADKGSPPGFP
jgi:hypothetical protein